MPKKINSFSILRYTYFLRCKEMQVWLITHLFTVLVLLSISQWTDSSRGRNTAWVFPLAFDGYLSIPDKDNGPEMSNEFWAPNDLKWCRNSLAADWRNTFACDVLSEWSRALGLVWRWWWVDRDDEGEGSWLSSKSLSKIRGLVSLSFRPKKIY